MMPEYGQWANMISRCHNPNASKYQRYGGRGISVCHRWKAGLDGKTGFECFLSDMGPRPTKKHSIERNDNNGDYCPGNCRWATNKEQSRNRSNNHPITYKGETMCMLAMAEKHGISYYVLRNRVSRGWPIDAAMTAPRGSSYRPKRTAVGNALPQTVLNEEKVRQIRKIHAGGGLTMLQVANQFGVSPANVCLIVNRKSWKHVI